MIKHYHRFITNPGSPFRKVRSARVSDDGSIEVVQVGVDNFDAYIDSFKLSCDINNIISRFRAGDESALHARPVYYGDFTKYPKTYAELLQSVIDARTFFDHLPVEVKKSYDSDFNKFFADVGSDSFMQKVSNYYKPVDAAPNISSDIPSGEKVTE